MKITLTVIFLLLQISAFSQTVADFENFNLPPESFLNGSAGENGFSSGNVFLPNDYEAASDSWSGWSISNTTDTQTAGFTNQYSAITGGGAVNTATYAVAFTADLPLNMQLENAATGEDMRGFYVTNNTYAYLSMLNGDAFAKRFGGVTGNDPDFFLLTIQKILNGIVSEEKIDIYLADYRFADNSQDFILTEWQYVDVRSLGAADALQFTLTSTDVGAFGMNTPAYFCLDEAETSDGVSSVNNPATDNSFDVFPNPARNFVQVKSKSGTPFSYCLFDETGVVIESGKSSADTLIAFGHLPAGLYFIRFYDETSFVIKKIMNVK